MSYSTELVWEDFHQQLFNFIYRRVDSRTEVEDILQDVFLKIHKNIDLVEENEKLPAWIYKIARNTIIDHYRKSGINRNVELDENFIIPEINQNGDAYSEIKSCLNSFIKILPDKYRDPVVLSELRGVKHKEVAKRLNISLPAAKSRILRGKEMIKQYFIDCCKFKLNESGKLIGGDWPNENCTECNTCKV